MAKVTGCLGYSRLIRESVERERKKKNLNEIKIVR